MFEKSVFANKLVIYVNVCVWDLHFNINKCSQYFTINRALNMIWIDMFMDKNSAVWLLFAVHPNNIIFEKTWKSNGVSGGSSLTCVCSDAEQLPAATNEHNTGREREKTEEVTADEHDRVLGVFQLLRRWSAATRESQTHTHSLDDDDDDEEERRVHTHAETQICVCCCCV